MKRYPVEIAKAMCISYDKVLVRYRYFTQLGEHGTNSSRRPNYLGSSALHLSTVL